MKKITSRFIWYIVLGLTGAALMILAGSGKIDEFWSGFGFGLVAVGFLRLIQLSRYRSNPEYADKMDIRDNDERNRFLADKSRSYAFLYSIMAECILTVVLRVIHMNEASTVMGLVICLQLVIYWVGWAVLRRKY